MNIILIGMRGSGKSTVAKLLGKRINREVIDLDTVIAQEETSSIADMVKNHGWDYFREKEAYYTKLVSQKTDVIISPGGGVIVRPENITALKNSGKIFYLRAAIHTLLQRIGVDTNRPALTAQKTQREEMEEVLQQRKPLYEQAADYIIDTDHKSKKDVLEEIIMNL